ncbi:hypothetical protein ILYODFUR_033178 [Ilyodon furcidens]|uniref:Uncharacterized protein n=1 Tax=Ilyodon furcidens TaxID=33524 RepID=A0ABV0UBS6_9TELE
MFQLAFLHPLSWEHCGAGHVFWLLQCFQHHPAFTAKLRRTYSILSHGNAGVDFRGVFSGLDILAALVQGPPSSCSLFKRCPLQSVFMDFTHYVYLLPPSTEKTFFTSTVKATQDVVFASVGLSGPQT